MPNPAGGDAGAPTGSFDAIVRARRTLVDGALREATVGIRDGVIARIGALDADWTAPVDTRIEDRLVLIPGLVDTHVHVNEPGRTEWEGFDTATRAAALGGVTTIIDMPLNSIPPTTTVAALEAKRAVAAAKARVDVGFWGGAVPENLGALRELHEAGVFGFKCFLSPSGVDEFGHLDRAQLGQALAELAAFDGLLIVHAEDPGVLAAHANDGGVDYRRFVASRPDAAETSAIAAVLEGLRATGGRAHILHLASAAALPLIRAAKAEGLRLTVETCPHYLTFEAERIPDGATQFKCCPPIRDHVNRDALWEGLVDGTIDFVASDHSPATRELKLGADGDFGRAWGGISGLALSLPAVLTGAAERGIGLDRVVDWLATAPAAFAGLADRGAIRVGARADLVALDPDRETTVAAADLAYRNRLSAFEGARLVGSVETVWLDGAVLDADAAPRGRLLTRA